MKARDEEYIWNRLEAPCTGALEAHERLKPHDPELAERLMKAMQAFTDECRAVRIELSSRRPLPL